MLRLWLCGRLAAELDGVTLPMPTSERARALIGFLGLRPGLHLRTDLAARLWPDVPEPSARASLRTAAWTLRQAWGPAAEPALVGSRTSLGLDPSVWVDARADDVVEDANGELLPGLDDEWARAARDEHLHRLLEALERRADEAEQQGRPAEAVRWSRRRCALAPLDEAAHRDLVRRLTAAGEGAAAVVASREFAERLRTELGVRPSPATRAVQSQLRPAEARMPRPQLFGRADELAALGNAWRTAAAGAGQIVVLTGEGGIGNPTVLAELAHRVGAAGGRIAVGAGIDVGGETPFAAWLELARALVATVAPVPSAAGWPAELGRLSPDLGRRLGRPDPPTAVAAPELERLRVFEAVLRLVEWATTDRPVLLALDDAHRADRASLRLTAHIARRVADLPVLVVLTRRDRPVRAELDAVLADGASRGVRITEIELAPIADDAVAALTRSIAPLDDDALQRVLATAEGNPLFAVESARAVASGATSPPPNLRSAVRAVIGTIDPSARALAELLAAAGRPLARSELERLGVASLPLAEQSAADAGLLVRRRGRLGFRHALLRQAAYADIADPAELHHRLAAAVDPEDQAEIAQHLALAGDEDEAAFHWRAAAEYAQSVGALAEAGEFLERALQHVPGDAATWIGLAEVEAWLGRRDRMEIAWARALETVAPAELPGAWSRRGRLLRGVVCHPTASLVAYTHAQEAVTDTTPADVKAAILVGLAWTEAVAGDPTRVEPLLVEARAFLPDRPDAVTASDLDEIRILGLIRAGRFAECAEIAWRSRDVVRRPDHAYGIDIHAACALACGGDHDGALALANRAVSATEQTPVLLVECLAARAHLLSRLGRHEEAAATVARQRACADRLDSPRLAATAAHDAGLVALAAGSYADAAALLRDALDHGANVSRPAAAIACAEALVGVGDADAAAVQLRAAVLEPVGPADQPGALVPRVARVQGLIAAAKGDARLALRRLDEAADGWRRVGATTGTAADGYFGNLVDLGRPPVVGLVEPDRELARIERERAAVVAGS